MKYENDINVKYSDFLEFVKSRGLDYVQHLYVDENMITFYDIYKNKIESEEFIILDIKNPELLCHEFSWIIINGINQFVDKPDSYKIKVYNKHLDVKLIQKQFEDNKRIDLKIINFIKDSKYYVLKSGVMLEKCFDKESVLRIKIGGYNIKNVNIEDVKFCIEIDIFKFQPKKYKKFLSRLFCR